MNNNLITRVSVKLSGAVDNGYSTVKTMWKTFEFICSTLVPAILIGITASWLMTDNAIDYVANQREQIIRPNQDFYIDSPIVLGDHHIGKARYKIWIDDLHGNTVFTYHPLYMNNKSGSVSFPFPKGLPYGEYIVRGRLTYSNNPLQQHEVQIVFGRVIVRN